LHARGKAAHKGRSPADLERRRIDAQYQSAVRNFEIAMRALQKQNYDRAAEVFEKLIDSEAREVAERARVHLRLCQRRADRPAPAPKSAEEYYTLGVACLNAGDFEPAVEHLSRANKLKPNQDHIRYALAAAHARQGNADAGIEHLQAAVSLRPLNRIQARHDEDFRGLVSDPRFRRLLYPASS
jgi:tetratricopeptide (TPR) repeat protein